MRTALLLGAIIIADAIMNSQGLSIHWGEFMGRTVCGSLIVFAALDVMEYTI